jgi:DNA repair exonuclease SbcCD ATPase subunit
LAGLKKKLTLETKIRDAAVSLSRVNTQYKNVSKQTNEQVDSANSKVESVQKDVWQLSEQVNEIHRRLMEHRASVLSYSLKRLEKSHHSVQSPVVNSMSFPSAVSSPTDSNALPVHTKFEHFFAGHSDAVIPEPRKKPPSHEDLAALDDKFNAATRELAEANRQQADLVRDLSLLRLEKEQLQATLEMELQIAEEHARSLGSELVQYKSEVEELRRQAGALELLRVELEERKGQAESLQQQLEAADQRYGEVLETNKQVLLKEQEITTLRAEMDAALRAKDLEFTNANTRFELETARWANELAPAEEASATLWAVVQEHEIPLPEDSDTTIPVLAESISFFIENTLDSVQELRQSVREQRELSNTLNKSREEAEAMRKEVRYLENQSRVCHYISTSLVNLLNKYHRNNLIGLLNSSHSILRLPTRRLNTKATRQRSSPPLPLCGLFYLPQKLGQRSSDRIASGQPLRHSHRQAVR